MSYIIAVKGPFYWKLRGRTLYATKREARQKVSELTLVSANCVFKEFDADHEPGKTLAKTGKLEF